MTRPIPGETPQAFGGSVPEAADVVVIGGGVIGVMSALFLVRAGARVLLFEKGRVAAEQSSRNWGWIRAQGRDWAELPIAMEAKRLWSEIAAECDVDMGLRRTGVSYLAGDAAAMERHAAWAARAKDAGLDTVVLEADQVAAMMPGAAERFEGALHTASDMRAEPWLAVPAVARLAEAEGAVIREGCAVRALDIAGGAVTGVITEAGRIATRDVVVAGGAWSRLLLARHGVRLPQLSVRSSAVATGPLPQVFDGQAASGDVAFRRRADGGYTLASGGRNELFVGRDAFASVLAYLPALRRDPWGTTFMPAAPAGFPDAWGQRRRWAADEVSPFERMRVLDPAPSARRVRQAVARFERLFPQVGRVNVQKSWAGMIDAMPDVVPVVDRVGPEGLTVATGMSGHGFGIGPAFGRIVAALVTGGTVGHDIARFRAGRFLDGSTLELGPAL